MKRTEHKTRPAIVYLATNKVDGKRYVGITCRQLNDRRSKHFWSAMTDQSQTYFHRAIRKYGKHSFEFLILARHETYEAAAEHEIKIIADMKPEYNQTKGGDGYLGYSPSNEQRRKHSERLKGKPGPWKGKKLAASFIAGGRLWNNSDEGKKSWRECAKLGPKSIQRAVVCLNDGLSYASVRLAAQAYGLDESSISAVCQRKTNRKTAGKRVFRFFGEHHGGIDEATHEQETARSNQLRHIGKGLSRRKAVLCVADGRSFETVKETASFYGVSSDTVIRSCKGRVKYVTINKNRFAYLEGTA